MPNQQFIQSVTNNLIYWRRQLKELQEQRLAELDEEYDNLLQAVQFGLVMPQTIQATAELTVSLFLFIERRGYWREWIPILKDLLFHGHQLAWHLKFRLFKELGQLQRLARQLPSAVENHLAALAVAQEVENEEAQVQVWFNLSEDYRLLRQYEEAERYALMALEGFSSSGANERWLAAVLNTLGLIAQARGNYALSEQRLLQAVAYWSQTDELTEWARAQHNLALTLQRQGRFEAALEGYLQARALLGKTTSEFDKSLIETSLGTLYFEQEKWSEAEAAFKRANSLYLQNSIHFYHRALVAQNLGNVLLTQQRFAQAEPHLRIAIELWQMVNDELMLANSLGTLGEVLVSQGKEKEAHLFLAEALERLGPYLADHPAAKQLFQEFGAVNQLLAH